VRRRRPKERARPARASAGRNTREQAPWARLEQLEPEAMTNSELLSLLGVGPTAPTLFELGRLDKWRLVELLGTEAAHTVRAAIELGRRALRARDLRPRLKTAREVYLYLEPALAARRRERFHALCLSSRRVLLADVLVTEGMEDGCLVDPREVFSAALAVRASLVVLAHNHPCGDPKPSDHDVALTEVAVKVGRLLGIWVVDHLVVGAGRYLSMAERGLCDF
jgi:DNA repair protein RadC